MSNKLLSIIVPAYNAESLLRECLDSFLSEEVVPELDVIIVNDGSQDNTRIIAEEYCSRYPESFRLINKENGGHGSGINVGIEYAVGEYLKVVDADDKLDLSLLPGFIALLRTICKSNNIDIVSSDFVTFDDVTGQVMKYWYASCNKKDYGNVREINKDEVSGFVKMHSMTIRTAILKKMSRKIDEKTYYVDTEYVTYPLPYCNGILYWNHPLYKYRLGRKGQSMDITVMKRNNDQHLKVLNSLLIFYDECVGEKVSEYHLRIISDSIRRVIENQFKIFMCISCKDNIRLRVREWDHGLKRDYSELYHAVRNKGVWAIRMSDYRLLKLAGIVYNTIH